MEYNKVDLLVVVLNQTGIHTRDKQDALERCCPDERDERFYEVVFTGLYENMSLDQ
jgi:hypothetical protein